MIGPTVKDGAKPGQNNPASTAKMTVQYESIERVDITPIDPQGRTGTDRGGQLVVFHYDDFESNDVLVDATPIGPTPIGLTQLFVGQRNIDPGGITLPPPFGNIPGDSDWYEIRPDKIGTFRFDMLFQQINSTSNGRPGLPDDGNLRIELYDANGNLITASDTSTNQPFPLDTSESITFSAAKNTTYYLRVLSTNAITSTTSGEGKRSTITNSAFRKSISAGRR